MAAARRLATVTGRHVPDDDRPGDDLRVLPNVTQTVRLIMPGSVAGVVVWLGGTLGFSFYVSHFSNFGITYGALGGIVVWMWFSSLALMLGAEVNAVLRRPPE